MGGDGGSIPKRRELVKTNVNKQQVSKEDNLKSRWQHCALSQEPLQAPVVACQLGRLFNKESLINFLLDKSIGGPQFNYITSLKDVKELKLTTNCEYSKSFEKSGSQNLNTEFICPITGIEMSGRFKFIYFYSCGCVLSERALREIKDNTCTKCNKVFADDDVIIINGDDDEVSSLAEKMNKRKLLSKRKRKPTAQLEPSIDEPLSKTPTVQPEPSDVEQSSSNTQNFQSSEQLPTQSRDIQNTRSTDNFESKINQKLDNGEGVKGELKSSKDKAKASKVDAPRKNKEKNKSVQNDPNASAAYKSLFSTHETAKRQAKAHWVTYNPLFY